MKLIVSQLNSLRTYVTREFYFIMTDLIANHHWQHIELGKLWSGRGTLTDNLRAELGELPETILFWEAYEFLQAHAPQIQRLNCRKVLFADDLHWRNEQTRQMKLVGFALSDLILAAYGYLWDGFYPQLRGIKKVVWIPHSASPDFMLDYNPEPANQVLLSGAVNDAYPLRQEMLRLHTEQPHAIGFQRHPGYYCGYDYATNADIGPAYAAKLNRHRAAFTDCLTFKYVVAKYFEIPATGALLLAEDTVKQQLNELGFVEYEHYLPASKRNLAAQVEYVLNESNRAELDQIRIRGQELVWARHKTSDRARQISQACNASC
jgi:hypothetical protein